MSKIILNFLLLFGICFNLNTTAQLRYIGTVRDAVSKSPMPNCTVAIKNKNIGTITNEEGQFVITLIKSDTLLFHYVGFETKKVTFDYFIKNSEVLIPPTPDLYYDLP